MSEFLSITGGVPLQGSVKISGAKNAALPLLIATLLSAEESRIRNVPDLDDVSVALRLLRSLGAHADYSSHECRVRTPSIAAFEAPYGLVKSMRASFWVLAPLLARARQAKVALAGGDVIGARPVDLHLKGLVQMGAEIRIDHGVVIASAPGGLRPGKVELEYPSVGATHQLLMAAALTPGITTIAGAAQEPEVAALTEFLTSMGAEIEGIGSDTLIVHGRHELSGGSADVIGDRVEATTYLIASAMTGGKIAVHGARAKDLTGILELLVEAGCVIDNIDNVITIAGPDRLRPLSFETAPFPGIATDTQPLLMAAATRAEGISRIVETVFEGRFGHVAQYARFGADIRISGITATVRGTTALQGATVEALDIRAAAGLVLMGLSAQGETIVREIHHLDRGYECLVEKLSALGAQVKRLPQFEELEVVVGC